MSPRKEDSAGSEMCEAKGKKNKNDCTGLKGRRSLEVLSVSMPGQFSNMDYFYSLSTSRNWVEEKKTDNSA